MGARVSVRLIGRRRLLVGAAAGLLAPGEALAGLRCDVPDFTGSQTCSASTRSDATDVFASDTGDQHRTLWCWAACVEMVLRHAGHPIRQERIVAETFGAVVNAPADTRRLLGALNRPWVDDHGVSVRVASENLLWNPAWLADPSPPGARQLADDHPLVIGVRGHAMVLVEVSYEVMFGASRVRSATVRDPWPDPRYPTGRRPLTRDEWLAVDLLAWVHVS